MRLIAADFMKGINFCSKRKPIINNWFRVAPKNLIEPTKQQINKEDDPDWELKELENNWKHSAAAKPSPD